jgi:DNA-binding beta-propeller fold protein YncE
MSRLGLILAAILALFVLSAPVARGAAGDPLFIFTPKPKPAEPGKPPPPPVPPPTGSFNGPCGVAVDGFGRLYVSDYYHRAVDLFIAPSPPFGDPPTYLGQLTGLDPLDGPCALALDGIGNLYLEDFHRAVAKFGPTPTFSPGPVFATEEEEPTGVAFDPATARLYVDERTHIGVYDSTGVPVLDGEGHSLRIGEGLDDGYGLAFSQFPGTAGRLYVADAATDQVEAYNTATPGAAPVQTISGPPGKAFTSLRDSALAVDRASGELYVVDDIQPNHAEEPEALIDVFAPDGTYEGHLKYAIVDARPPGLAVDNSPQASQGRLYVTSGNTSPAALYAYPPGSALLSAPLPPSAPSSVSGGEGASSSAAAARASARPASPPTATASTIAQKGTLRVSVDGHLSPRRLPRSGVAPIAVSVAGEITTTDESLPPLLKTLRIELNRHGHLDTTGLPTCTYDRIQPASDSRALAACRSALVGQGSFSADITLAGQEPYPTHGRLLLFNGKSHGKPVLYGHIYSPRPFATSFVIVFSVQKLPHGVYGTALNAPLPKAMETWGRLTALRMTLQRTYRYRGERHSYISSGCPAPKGFGLASFPLARAGFAFAGRGALSSTVVESCRVR